MFITITEENLITQGIDVLNTISLDSNILTPVISRAYQQDIPVIFRDKNIESEDFTNYVHEARKANRNGGQDASFTYPTDGREKTNYDLAILSAESVPKKIIFESLMVTPQNADLVKPIH